MHIWIMVINGHKNFIGHRWKIIYESSLFLVFFGDTMKQIEISDMIHYDFPIFGMAWTEHIRHMDSMSKWLWIVI